MFSLIYAWINDLVNNREAGDLRRQHGHYDVIVMIIQGYFRGLPTTAWMPKCLWNNLEEYQQMYYVDPLN